MLIATKLLARAERETAKEKLKTLPRVERASAELAAAFQILFDTTSEQVDTDTGEISPPEVETLAAGPDGTQEGRPSGDRHRPAHRVVAAPGAVRAALGAGPVDWKAYAFCVLEQVHRMLRSKQVFAKNSSKWGDPRAKLLDGEAWEQAKPTALASLNLPAEAGEHLAARAALLDGTYREVGYAAEACTAALDWFDGVLPGEPVVLATQTANVGSMRLAAKLGFTEVERFQAWDAEQWLGLRFPVAPSA